MDLHFIQPLMHFLHHHEHSAGLIVAFITFIESLAVIGSFVPGSLTLGAAGALIGAGTIPAISTIIYVSLGAFIGDLLSYGLGKRYKEHLSNIWPFSRYPKLLASTKTFCDKHGGLSIFIGRFTGPMRSFVPMITGMMGMPLSRFVSVTLPCDFAWVVTFMLPGIFLGALSQEVPASVATEFVLIGLLVILLIWFLLWCITHFFEQITWALTELCDAIWHTLQRSRSGQRLVNCLAMQTDPGSSRPIKRCLLATMCLLAFALVWLSTAFPWFDTSVNEPLYHLIRSLRTPTIQPFFVIITMLGKYHTVLLATAITAIWLTATNRLRQAAYLTMAMTASLATVWCIKHLGFIPRPGHIYHTPDSSSFPSGHVVFSVTMMALLATWIRDTISNPRWRWLPFTLVSVLGALIAFSRLYLGMHWLSDVCAGALLAVGIVQILRLCFDRKRAHHSPSALSLGLVTLCAMVLAWVVVGSFRYVTVLRDTTPIYQLTRVDLDSWWQHDSPSYVPIVRTNRFGRPDHALNVQWVGQAHQIVALLQAHGWKLHPSGMTFKAALHRLTSKEPLPLLPKLYQNKPPEMLMTWAKGKYPLILRLWSSNTELNEPNMVLWLGTVGTTHPRQHFFNIHPYPPTMYSAGQIDTLIKSLRGSIFEWKLHTVKHHLSIPAASLHWDKKLIQIRPTASA